MVEVFRLKESVHELVRLLLRAVPYLTRETVRETTSLPNLTRETVRETTICNRGKYRSTDPDNRNASGRVSIGLQGEKPRNHYRFEIINAVVGHLVLHVVFFVAEVVQCQYELCNH